jgi:hypothetical protein
MAWPSPPEAESSPASGSITLTAPESGRRGRLTGGYRVDLWWLYYRDGRVTGERSHSDAWAGWTVCSITASSSAESASRSTCSRNRAANPSTVRASERRRLKRRST